MTLKNSIANRKLMADPDIRAKAMEARRQTLADPARRENFIVKNHPVDLELMKEMERRLNRVTGRRVV